MMKVDGERASERERARERERERASENLSETLRHENDDYEADDEAMKHDES